MPRPAKRFWYAALAAVVAVCAAVVVWDWAAALPPDAIDHAQYVGRATCAECHTAEHNLWLGSHHDRAMEVADEGSVLGDFNDATFSRFGVTTRFFRRDGGFFVNTEGPDGANHDYQIRYTFGVEPLQQYMVEFPGGRLQVLRVSWDTGEKRWFEVTPPDAANERIPPGDPVHWTGIGQNWNTTCADCHSTNVKKGYDPTTNSYHTTYQEIDVSCEECHGPGSVHVDLARSKSLFWDRHVGYGLPSLKSPNIENQLSTCAKCHSHRAQVHEEFRPGKPLMDYYASSLLSSGLYHVDGQIRDEVYEYGSFLQSKMYANHVKCTDCHNPHSLQLKFPGNNLCTQCHEPGKFDTPAHHHHLAGSTGAQCVECHMPAQLYMVIDSRRDHSLRIPRPDLSVTYGVPNACVNCHTKPEETNEWAAETVLKWYGDRRPNDPHWAPAFAAARERSPAADQLLLELIERKTTPVFVRASAVSLLGEQADVASVNARRNALVDEHPLIRRAAVSAAESESWPTVESDLLGRLTDPIRAVRVAAAVRLAYLPRDNLTTEERDLFARVLDEYRESQGFSVDHAGGHMALASLDRHLADRLRAAQSNGPAAQLDQSAVDHWRAAIVVEPYIAGPRSELANVLAARGGDPTEIRRLREEELELLKRDAQLAPDSGQIHYRLAMAHVLLGQLEEAADALRVAVRLMPTDYTSRMALALVFQELYQSGGNESDYAAAVRELNALHDLDPGDPRAASIMRNLARIRAEKQGPKPN